MDILFSSTSQRTLSVALSVLVKYLHQNERGIRQWRSIRSSILNDLNTLVCEGQFSALSALIILASYPRGRQLLINDACLMGKVTTLGLNAVIAEGEEKDKSALFFLAGNHDGLQLLIEDKDLRGKITGDGLNAFIPEGESEGYTALLLLAGNPVGRQLLVEDKALRNKITADDVTLLYVQEKIKVNHRYIS